MSRRHLPVIVILLVVAAAALLWRLRARDSTPAASTASPSGSARTSPPPAKRRTPSRVRLLGVEVVPGEEDALGALTGTVVSGGDGRPIAGAVLFFETPTGDGLHQVRAGSEGGFRFVPSEPGWHRLAAAEADGFVPYGENDAPLVFHARIGRGVASGPITLRPITSATVVVVDAPTGEPLAGAEVLLLDGSSTPVTVDDRGEATLSLDDGAVVEATAVGHRPARARYGVSEQVAHRLTLALERTDDPTETSSSAGERLAGAVRDPSGEPIEDARVLVRWVPPASADPSLLVPNRQVVTGDDGTFVVERLDAGRYDVVAQAAGFAEAMASSVAVPGPDVSLTLRAGVSLFGRVTDREGEPLPSFAVVVTRKIHALASHTVAVEQALDPDGEYEVPNLAPGDYVVFAIAAGAARSDGKPITLSSGDTRVDFELATAGTLTGVVVERDGGDPIGGAKVSIEGRLIGDLQLAGTAFTDDEGRFTLGGLGETPTSILVAAEAHHARLLSGIVVAAGEQKRVSVDLERVEGDEEPKIELAGIGTILQGTPDGLVIKDVVEGGGAAEVGLGPGDVIISIGGVEAAELGFGGCIERLRGPEGSTVTVTVLRSGSDGPVAVVIPRRRIKA